MTVINTNIAANNTYRQMNLASNEAASSMEKLSSGLRINRAADDAAGLSIAEGLKAQSNGLEVAARNANDAVSLIQTAEGGLSSAHEILQRVRDLAVQAGNDSNNAEARTAIQAEVNQLADELTRMSESINFNGINLLDGSGGTDADGSFSFQVGASGAANAAADGFVDQITVDVSGADLAAIADSIRTTTHAAAAGTLDLTSATAAAAAIETIDTQIATVSTERSNLGAVQNRLEQTIKHVNISAENLTAAESNIRDVDMAKEMVELSANNIKTQASQAMLAQANQSTQGILQLLR